MAEDVPRTLDEAAGGSERTLLVAMRSRVAREIDSGVPAHALAALVRQLRELDREIRALEAADANKADAGIDTSFDASVV